MAKGVTLTDIAERVGVSNVAVHKELTDKPGVNAQLRDQIKALAKEMGYTGTTAGTGKVKPAEKTGNIGVIIPEQYYGAYVMTDHLIGKGHRQIGFVGRVDAYLCNCDFIADIVIQNLEAKRYQVPQDISVVGIDDFWPSGVDDTRITTYKVDMERMAEACVGSLIRKIKGETYVKGIQLISGEIVCKRSVAERRSTG